MRRHLERGFTLIELVLALSIVAIMVTMLFGGLRVGLRAWQRGEERAAALQHTRSMTQLLQEALGGIHAYRGQADKDTTAQTPVVMFQGAAERVSFVTVSPPMSLPAAIAFVAVTLSMDAGDAPGLAIREKALPNFNPFEAVAPSVVDPTITAIRFRYLRDDGTWEETWDGQDERIFVVTTGFYLVALDAKTGVPVKRFGVDGAVDLMAELHVGFDHVTRIGNSSPPMVYRDTVIVPPALEEGFTPDSMQNTPGYVMAFDARTGKQKWAFHTVPKDGEFGAETWEQKSNAYTGNTGVWAPISVDPELGRAYLPVETPTDDYYGGHRLGSNLFANSVVSVDLETGKRIWHTQITHHDIWNYDLPSAPALVNMTVEGKPVKALVQLTKQGYAYVLDRMTGQPVWPFEERPAPPSDVPGEHAWPTQPHPTKPAAYDYQGYVENDLIDFTPELRAEAIRIARQYRLGPLFTPPSEIKPDGTKGTWYNPGGTGGSLWQGGGFDPETNFFYIPSKSGPGITSVRKDPKSDLRFSRGPGADLSVKGLPILRPPYSRITALNLNTGEFAWVVPLGTTPASVSQNSALKGVNLPNTGGVNLQATLLVTKTLLIAGEGWGGAPIVRAYDKKTGAVLAEVRIPGQMGSMPMTYTVNGKQYIAFTVGTPTEPAELVALALEK